MSRVAWCLTPKVPDTSSGYDTTSSSTGRSSGCSSASSYAAKTSCIASSACSLGACVDLGEHVALRDLRSPLGAADDAHRVIDVVVFGAPPRTEVHGGVADADCAQLDDVPGSGGDHLADHRGDGQRRFVGGSALRFDPAAPDRLGAPVRDRSFGPPPSFCLVNAEVGEREQLAAGVEHDLGEVGRPLPTHGVERLAHLERVADRLPERLVHVGQEADDLTAGLPAERDHRLGELARALDRLHERAVADLHVEHDRLGAAGELLRHDRRGDQRELVDRRRHVAERVEQLVGRDEVAGLADDRDADVANLRDELVEAQLGAEAGNRLELVERAARVPEAAAAHLPERHAARGDERRDRQRRLVADAAGRVLVATLRPGCAPRSIVSPLRTIASVSANVSRSEGRGRRRPCRTRPSGSRAPRRARSRGSARRSRRLRAPRRRACAGSARRA